MNRKYLPEELQCHILSFLHQCSKCGKMDISSPCKRCDLNECSECIQNFCAMCDFGPICSCGVYNASIKSESLKLCHGCYISFWFS